MKQAKCRVEFNSPSSPPPPVHISSPAVGRTWEGSSTTSSVIVSFQILPPKKVELGSGERVTEDSGVMVNQFSGLESRSGLSSNSNAPRILAVNGSLTFIALVVVVLRIYVRTAMLDFWGSDDYVIVAAMVSSLQCSVPYVWIAS